MSSRSRPFALVLVYLLVIVAVDLTTPSNLRLDVFAALAPMTAAAVCTYQQTVFVGVLDFCLMVAHHGVLNSDVAVNRVGSFVGNALMVGASIAVARLRRDGEDLLERVRATGEAAQRALLRPLPLRTHSVVVDGFYVSSQREALVGGDLYEVVDTPYGTRVLIGDVRGKGLGTLGAGAAVLTAFREAAYHRRDLESGVEAMEQGLYRYHRSAAYEARSTGAEDTALRASEEFVTALVFGTEEAAAPEAGAVPVVFVDCGHVAPFLIGPEGGARELETPDPGLPLGLGDLATAARTTQRVELPAGSRVLACTDGVTEARAPDGGFYPLAERLDAWATLSTSELLERLRADLDAHTGGKLQDDAAVLVMERVPVGCG